jgi:hypothetical protein
MTRPVRHRLAALLATLCCATAAAAAEGAKPLAVSVAIAAGDLHEECLHLAKGASRAFTWKSDQPLDFNIHYHQGKDVTYPVKADGRREGRGTFTATVAQDYCWMWSAKAGANLEGEIR